MGRIKKIFLAVLLVVVSGLLVPQRFVMPVAGATKADYNDKSFWYFPWGKSGTHKGVDIFAKSGTDALSATDGVVIYSGKMKYGGEVVLVLGPKWRVHYYAHLRERKVSFFDWMNPGEKLGTVGSSGNAKGKQPHLHYSITSCLPYLWRMDDSPQGWKKIFYLNPIKYIEEAE